MVKTKFTTTAGFAFDLDGSAGIQEIPTDAEILERIRKYRSRKQAFDAETLPTSLAIADQLDFEVDGDPELFIGHVEDVVPPKPR